MTVDIAESPDYSTWTLEQLLIEARRLPLQFDPLFTWDHLRDIVFRRDLGVLCRHPKVEHIYVNYFNPMLRSEHGSVEAYLKKRLGWTDHSTRPFWTRDQSCQVRLNDWAYSVPRDVEHYVIWTQAAMFHPALCSSTPSKAVLSAQDLNPTEQEVWQAVTDKGLGGATGVDTTPEGSLVYSADGSDGPAREIIAFVLQRWPESQTLWFANPPSLQSVPGLSHFHVLVKRPNFT